MSMNRDEQPGLLNERSGPRGSGKVAPQSSMIGPAAEPSRFSPRASNGLQHSVELHIEDLVLNGFAPANRYAIGEAIERELTRLFTEQGSPIAATEGVEIADLNGGAINLKPGSSVEATAIQLARAIYGGLGQ